MKHKLTLATLTTLLPLSALAADKPEEKSPYKASAELGALYKSGNNESADIKGGFDLDYNKEAWRHSLRFDTLIRKTEKTRDDGSKGLETTNQKWNLSLQTNYTLDKANKNYLYGNGQYEDDRFNGFENQWSLSTGWGRRWYETDATTFDADIGPGFKRDVLVATDTSPETNVDSFILQAQFNYVHKFNKFVQIRQTAVGKYAFDSDTPKNHSAKAETSIISKIADSLQLKFSFKVDYNSHVEGTRKNTDTQTGVTLVYSFI